MKHAIPPIVCFLLLALVAIALVLCMGGCAANDDGATHPSGQMVIESVDVLTPRLTAYVIKNKSTNQTFLVIVERLPGYAASGVAICELKEPK